jgi:hypothetical protein
MKIKHLLFNPKYFSGSLYGVGVFPFWLYIAFYGKPVYRFSRKRLNLSRFFSLMMANIPGSAFHVGFFKHGWTDVVGFVISLVTMTWTFTFMHQKRPLLGTGVFLIGLMAWSSVGLLLR